MSWFPECDFVVFVFVCFQNADDAGATVVSVLVNHKQYGTNSLLGPRLAEWQGPSVYVYNDAVFSEHDFHNLSRIGQHSKLDKLGTTGRFGLGFNAVYHFTGRLALAVFLVVVSLV